MLDHVKPTKEELEEDIKNKLNDLTDKKPPEEKKPDEMPSVEKEPEKKPEPEVTEVDVKPEDIKPQAEPKPEPEKKPEAPVDYKKKFIENQRENIALHSQKKIDREAYDRANSLQPSTDEEMAIKYPDWDVLSETEKLVRKDLDLNNRRYKILYEASQAGKDIQEWSDKVDKYAADPKTLVNHPDLEGRVDDFKIFVSKPSRRGADLDDLVSAFLFEIDKIESSKPKNKGAMFETGSGGAKEKEKLNDGKISIDEARRLRTTDYKKYKELLKAGKIDTTNVT
jgi:hypothetical protein